jgi:hypothetical protein
LKSEEFTHFDKFVRFRIFSRIVVSRILWFARIEKFKTIIQDSHEVCHGNFVGFEQGAKWINF